ncbi:MAG: hypothetical protein HYS32_02475 [Candidatus Woesearchaeota archaeon]|nr:MAG: hypothetical protein HYS32_02475 [Candidatus Woesearchaeota archaeon]
MKKIKSFLAVIMSLLVISLSVSLSSELAYAQEGTAPATETSAGYTLFGSLKNKNGVVERYYLFKNLGVNDEFKLDKSTEEASIKLSGLNAPGEADEKTTINFYNLPQETIIERKGNNFLRLITNKEALNLELPLGISSLDIKYEEAIGNTERNGFIISEAKDKTISIVSNDENYGKTAANIEVKYLGSNKYQITKGNYINGNLEVTPSSDQTISLVDDSAEKPKSGESTVSPEVVKSSVTAYEEVLYTDPITGLRTTVLVTAAEKASGMFSYYNQLAIDDPNFLRKDCPIGTCRQIEFTDNFIVGIHPIKGSGFINLEYVPEIGDPVIYKFTQNPSNPAGAVEVARSGPVGNIGEETGEIPGEPIGATDKPEEKTFFQTFGDKDSYKNPINYINPTKGQFWVGLAAIGLLAFIIKKIKDKKEEKEEEEEEEEAAARPRGSSGGGSGSGGPGGTP